MPVRQRLGLSQTEFAQRIDAPHIEELLRLLTIWDLPHHLGEVFYRVRGEEERLSLSIENLLQGLALEPATPSLSF